VTKADGEPHRFRYVTLWPDVRAFLMRPSGSWRMLKAALAVCCRMVMK
jgi:hypothetical protein